MRVPDIEQPGELAAYLRATGRVGPDEPVRCVTLAGGVSNRTVRVERGTGEAWVVKQALEKLRVPVDWFSDPARIHREALGMQWLAELAPPGTVPALLFEDPAAHLLAMQAVPEPHANWKTLLLAGRLERRHVAQFATLLGTIHRRSHDRKPELADVFADQSFFESLRLEPYYRYTAARVPEAADFLHALADETAAHRLALVHGDYSPKNVLVHRDRLVLLDHEVIHFGDPAFDVGFSLTHLLAKANHLADRRGDFAAAAVFYVQTYREALGDVPWTADLEPRAVRHTLACLLARVAGRSPLEYLSDAARRRQQTAACALLADPPDRLETLVHRFVALVKPAPEAPAESS